MDARNQEYEGDQRCAYAVHISNNIIRKESQSPIREVLARSCWKAGPGQEASDGSKVRREGRLGLLYPMKFGRKRDRHERQRLQSCTGVVRRPQSSAPGRKRIRSGDDVYACAVPHALERQCLHPCDDGCHVGGVFFHKHPKFQRLGDDVCRMGGVIFHKHPKLQRSGNDVYVRATTLASGQ